MTILQKTGLFVVSVVFVCLTTSCETVNVHQFPAPGRHVRPGPPPHARAHGYCRKHANGLELVYDSTYGVYVIMGKVDHYYWDGQFYRIYGGRWEVSLQVDAGWVPAIIESLPPGLQYKGQGKAVGHKRRAVASSANYKSRGKTAF